MLLDQVDDEGEIIKLDLDSQLFGEGFCLLTSKNTHLTHDVALLATTTNQEHHWVVI